MSSNPVIPNKFILLVLVGYKERFFDCCIVCLFGISLRQRINTLVHWYSMKQHSEQQQKALKVAADSLYKAFLTMDKPAEVRQFLLDLCTPSELEAIVDRWWTASLLKEGRSYRDISEITGVSVTTIGRVARYLNMGEGGYRLALRREKARTVRTGQK